jgi:microsomal epoxide hydrolase
MIKEFNINVSSEQISEIKSKIENYPWSYIEENDGWELGTNKNYLKELCKYWTSDFDWKKHEKLINSFSNFKTNVDGIDIHFIKEKGSGKNPKPLLLMHGWPGSIIEFLEIIKPLAHPEDFGGNIEDALTVIAPSLPGFGFSGAPYKTYWTKKYS